MGGTDGTNTTGYPCTVGAGPGRDNPEFLQFACPATAPADAPAIQRWAATATAACTPPFLALERR